MQGTVTAADDGSPIFRADVRVRKALFSKSQRLADVQTNNQGDYSLSFIEMGFCPEGLLSISASARGFQSMAFGGLLGEPDEPQVRCTDEPQTVDFQLERETTASTT